VVGDSSEELVFLLVFSFNPVHRRRGSFCAHLVDMLFTDGFAPSHGIGGVFSWVSRVLLGPFPAAAGWYSLLVGLALCDVPSGMGSTMRSLVSWLPVGAGAAHRWGLR
jgi:hypothetical protein